jgi:uncharacterized protein with GYD domain
MKYLFLVTYKDEGGRVISEHTKRTSALENRLCIKGGSLSNFCPFIFFE